MFNMNHETMFSVVGVLSFIGWGALVFSPLRHKQLVLSARLISILLAIIYSYFVVSTWGQKPTVDFSSLAGVANGFTNMSHLLTGWIHYLALDLFIGAWQVERAKKIGIPHIILLPCLLLTFLFGPLGVLLFLVIQSIKTKSFKIA
ncbi:MAG: DUF4281 domain-containing protein [Algicola sp.]|nr:DUF4281 domain-containing protein [Algicola sp.]